MYNINKTATKDFNLFIDKNIHRNMFQTKYYS